MARDIDSSSRSTQAFSKTTLAGAIGSALLAVANGAWAGDPFSCELDYWQCSAGCSISLSLCTMKCNADYPADSDEYWACLGECLTESESCRQECTKDYLHCLGS